MKIQDFISFVDIGGLTESTYHNVFFKNYCLIDEGGSQIITPSLEIGFVKVDVPEARNARDILIDLLNLYNKITTLPPSQANSAIIDWCNRSVHPYNIEKINMLFQESNEEVYAQDLVEMAKFPIDTFKKDLISLGAHFNFYYALEMARWKNPNEAMNLYKKYDGWSEYSYFEKSKKKAIQESGNDEKKALILLNQYIIRDEAEYQQILVKKFHTFKMSLIIDPKTKKPVHHIAIDSIFDIAWFAFSKLITEDASYVSLQDENYYDDFSDDEYVNESQPVTRCPICGDYIKKIKNKKYCNKPECQKRRAAIKSMNYTKRKKAEQQEKERGKG